MSRRPRGSRLRCGQGTWKQRCADSSRAPTDRPLRLEALEDRRLLAITVNTLMDENDGVGVGGVSLRDAIAAAGPGNNVINFSVTGTISLTLGQLLINKDLTITGPGAGLLTIDQDTANNRVLNIDNSSATRAAVFISGVTITGGSLNSPGGGIRNRENLTISASTITGNSGTSGGGIYNYEGTLVINSSTISNNTAARGGGLYNNFATASLTGSTISANRSTSNSGTGGGGAMNISGTLNVTDSTFAENKANFHGGGVHNVSASLTVLRGAFTDNVADDDNTGVGWGGGVANSTGSSMTLTDSTLSGNKATHGGGALSEGAINVTRTTVRNNESTVAGGGLNLRFTGGSIVRSKLHNNHGGAEGGGLVNYGALTISDTSIYTNGGAKGGGISHHAGNLTITGSTISGNSASSHGGGVWTETTLNVNKTLIINSTISANSGFDAIGLFNAAGATEVRHSTITRNGIASQAANSQVAIYSSIVAGGQTVVQFLGTGPNPFVSLGYNVIGQGNAKNAFSAATHDMVDVLDPKLGGLADNGGPTKTQAPFAESPAIDGGQPGAVGLPATDQRGGIFTRVSGARIDVGAVESQTLSPSYFVVGTLADEFDEDSSPADLSLREALVWAAASAGRDTITFSPALTAGGPASLVLTLGELAITSEMIIQGPGAHLLTIDARGNDPTPLVKDGLGSRVFFIGDGDSDVSSVVEIAGLTLTGGDVSLDGGAIMNAGGGALLNGEILTVELCRIVDNAASRGGAIAGGATVRRSTINGNRAEFSGGGIHGYLLLFDSTINDNHAGTSGGGVAGTGGSIVGSTISGNSAGASGGGVSADGSLTVRSSTIVENWVNAVAPAGVFNSSFAMFENSILAKNFSTATTASLGINGTVTAANSIFQPGALTGDLGGNLFVLDPLLGPLANNGGPMMTHAPLAGSRAIDGGRLAPLNPNNPYTEFDQRGSGFPRIVGARIDVGAVETAFTADFGGDRGVGGIDFLAWQRGFGKAAPTAQRSDGDADADLDVDGVDYLIWKNTFGLAPAPPIAVPQVGTQIQAAQPAATDAIFAQDDVSELFALNEGFVRGKRRGWRR